jgi:glycosyltransferase involved in cell wall biosynthesis
MRIYIPFGIDTNFFIPLDSNGGNYVLSFGKIKRDYDTLIHAWNKLGRNIHLKIIGVSDIDTLYNPNIEILPRCSIQELKNEVAGSKFVIIPLPDLPYANGQTSVLQAMAMGKTVIVSKTQGIKDYIIDGSGAFYVEPYNSNDIVDKVNTLLDNEMLIKDSDRKAREYVVNNFSEELMGKYLYEYLISL